jgi:hypothetical protein
MPKTLLNFYFYYTVHSNYFFARNGRIFFRFRRCSLKSEKKTWLSIGQIASKSEDIRPEFSWRNLTAWCSTCLSKSIRTLWFLSLIRKSPGLSRHARNQNQFPDPTLHRVRFNQSKSTFTAYRPTQHSQHSLSLLLLLLLLLPYGQKAVVMFFFRVHTHDSYGYTPYRHFSTSSFCQPHVETIDF